MSAKWEIKSPSSCYEKLIPPNQSLALAMRTFDFMKQFAVFATLAATSCG
jgi:hypothetical protein